MKKYFKMLAFCCLGTISLQAQVGMTSNAPNKNAVLDLNKTDGTNTKGLLLPKVALTGVSSASPMSAHVAGMKIYNTATAGSGVNAVTPGEYVNDGAKWVRISSNAWKLTGNANTTPGTDFIGTIDNKDLVFKANSTEILRARTNGNVGVVTSVPNAKIDIRSSPTSTTNPGEGFLGVGSTTLTASLAGAGALRYSTSSGGTLEYSNGVVWNQLSSTVAKTVVIATKKTPQTILHNVWAYVVDWYEYKDNNDAFDAVTGTFKAPRDGIYTISFGYLFNWNTVQANGQIEAILLNDTDPNKTRKSVCAFPVAGGCWMGTQVSMVFKLNAGDTIRTAIYQNTGYAQSFNVDGATGDDRTNLTITEL